MPQGETITHEGTVVRVSPNGTADVEIVTGDACSRCNVKSACSLGKSDIRTITVISTPDVAVGDRVTVVMSQSQGFRALVIGYIIPFFVLVLSFALFNSARMGELMSALASLAILGMYYLAVWLFRNRIEKKFEFKIKD